MPTALRAARFLSASLLLLGRLGAETAAASHQENPDGGAELDKTAELHERQSAAAAADDSSGLEAWLASIVFIVPDSALSPVITKLRLLVGDITIKLHIHNLKCTHLRIGSRQSDGSRVGGLSTSLENVTLAIHATGLRFLCTGRVDYMSSLGLSGTADVEVQAQDAALSVALALESSDAEAPHVPNSLAVRGCDCKSRVTMQIKGGSAWTRILNVVPTAVAKLEDLLNTELDKYTCGAGLDAGVAAVTHSLASLNATAHQLLQVPVPSTELPRNDSFVVWEEEAVVQWLQEFQVWAIENDALGRALRSIAAHDDLLCFVGNTSQDTLCMFSEACVFGASNDTECLVNMSLHGGPEPAVLRVDVRSAEVALTKPTLTTVSPGNSSLSLRANASRVELRSRLRVAFRGWAGGAEAGDGKGFETTLDLNLALEGAELGAVLLAGLDRELFEQVPSIFLWAPKCLAPSFRDLRFLDIAAGNVRFTDFAFFVQNTTTTSPLLIEAGELVNDVFKTFGAYEDLIVPALNGYMRSEFIEPAEARLNEWSAKLAQETCPQPRGFETIDGWSLINPLFSRICFLIASGLVLLAFMRGIFSAIEASKQRRRDQASPQPLNYCAYAEGSPPVPRFHFEDCLCMSPGVPRPVAIIVVLAIIGCDFWLLGSNFERMAETFVVLRGDDTRLALPFPPVHIYQVMVYSLFYSIHALRKEQMILLADVLLAFSGILPHLKLFVMLVSWLLPARIYPRKLRGILLHILDQIGKFSLVDVFVIQFISGALNDTTVFGPLDPDDGRGPAAEADEGSRLAVLLRTSQSVGFAAFVSSTVGSLLLGHVCLYCHEQDPYVRRAAKEGVAAQPSTFLAHSGRAISLREAYRGRRKMLIGPALMITLLCLVVGCSLEAFTVVLECPFGELTRNSHSVYDFIFALPFLDEAPYSFTARFSQATFCIFAVVTIHCHILLLLTFWYVKVPVRLLNVASFGIRTLAAWSALDVALLSMVITLLEMTLTNFVDIRDASTRDLLSKLTHKDVDRHGLSVHVTLGIGTSILVMAVLLHVVAGREVMQVLDITAASQEAAASAFEGDAGLLRQHTELASLTPPRSRRQTSSGFGVGSPSVFSGVEPAEDGPCLSTAGGASPEPLLGAPHWAAKATPEAGFQRRGACSRA